MGPFQLTDELLIFVWNGFKANALDALDAALDGGGPGPGLGPSSSGSRSGSARVSIGGPGARVRFEGSEGRGVRGPSFEASEDAASAADASTQLYVLNWDDDPVELYEGGVGPAGGFGGFTGQHAKRGDGGGSADADEAATAWAEAVPDEGSAGEEVTVAGGGGDGDGDGDGGSGGAGRNNPSSTSSWRRVGDAIIYNEEEVIGVGSSGTYVFRGYVQHTTRARHAVAVKRIARPPGDEGRELLKLVEREVELLTALNQSPRVPFFHCWGITSSHLFIALELCTESLREHVTRNGETMTSTRRMDILASVAESIAWLHDPTKPSGCITHNDLKPENLLVDSTGNVKIADVGLGVQLQGSGRASTTRREYTMSTFRKYGIDIVLAGRAPEMLTRRPLTPAADIWAMGVVFYFVLTGRASPFSESGRDVPTDAAIINGRVHLQSLMRVGGLQPRRALEARHLLASMLAPDPAQRPSAAGVVAHPLFWDDERAMRELVALHARSASMQTEMGTFLSNVATDALLGGGGGAGTGNSERGALLAAASMDLTDWQGLVDPVIRTRVTTAQLAGGGNDGGGKGGGAKADGGGGGGGGGGGVGRKPYGDGFADLLRFCRNAYEHPPTGDEIEPMVNALVEASAALAGSPGSGSGSEGPENDDGDGAKTRSLLPPGIVPGMAYRRLTRKQRRDLLASYLLHLFPGLPLAVHECALAAGPDVSKARGRGAKKEATKPAR